MITKKARIVRYFVLMVMNGKSAKREAKTNDENINNPFIHQPTISFYE
jgi:hypothetical protein